MKDLNRILFLGVVLMLMAGCSKMEIEPNLIPSGDNAALKGAMVELVPFKSAFETSKVSEEYIYYQGNPIGFHVVVDGSGNANHLGRTSISVDQEWFFSQTGGPLTGTSVITLTAANGDELIIDFSGLLIPTPDWSKLDISGKGIIVPGGSGRFEDACGEVDLIATFDNLAGEGETLMTGTIMY